MNVLCQKFSARIKLKDGSKAMAPLLYFTMIFSMKNVGSEIIGDGATVEGCFIEHRITWQSREMLASATF